MNEMDQKEQEVLRQMREMALPGSMEYMSKIRGAAKYIVGFQLKYKEAKRSGLQLSFKTFLDKYFRAWKKVWRKMALELYDPSDVNHVDMQVYRHLPDGYSFKVYSSVLDIEFTVYPRKPKVEPEGKWLTAEEVIKIIDNPSALEVIKVFPDTWIHREPIPVGPYVTEELLALRRRVVPRLKFKETKKNWHYYEEDMSYDREEFGGRSKKVSKKNKPGSVHLQNKRLFYSGDD